MFPQYSRAERIADAIVHAVGVMFALTACVTLAVTALPSAEPLLLFALGAYGVGLISMLGCSALYNLTKIENWKDIFRRLDHAAIFVMIAGTYTPFALISIGGAWGIDLLIFVWVTAFCGVVFKLLFPWRFERLSVAAYLLLGWSVLVALHPLLAAVSSIGIILLATGGVLYSLGVVVHLSRHLPYQNAIWHTIVLAAVACHFAAVVREFATAS
jgi:hemolysin III